MKEFSCGDEVPGCGVHITGDSDEAILTQVAAHAAADHGITSPGADLVEAVIAKMRLVV